MLVGTLQEYKQPCCNTFNAIQLVGKKHQKIQLDILLIILRQTLYFCKYH